MADVVDFTPFFMEVDQQNSKSTKMQTCFHPTTVFADAVPPNELDRHLTAYQALSTASAPLFTVKRL